jgi:ATP-dependent RNA helicase DDX58
MHSGLGDISKSPAGDNPKLQVLEKKILSRYDADDSKRGILFCKTREMTKALMNWMKDNPRLAMLNPNILIGARNTTRNGGTVQCVVNIPSKDFVGISILFFHSLR